MNLIKRRFNAIVGGAVTDEQVEAEKIIKKGYYQVSRKFRTLARLPKGMTGKQALLKEVKEFQKEWVDCLGEGEAGDYYLRCHSSDKIEISESLFYAFRKMGGNTYRTIWWEKHGE